MNPGRLTQSETPYWALFDAKYRTKKTTTLTEYIKPDSMTICMARLKLKTLLGHMVPANALREWRSTDHILRTIKARNQLCQHCILTDKGTWYTCGKKVEDKGDRSGRGDEWLELSCVEERVGMECEFNVAPERRHDCQIVMSSK